MKKSPFSIEHEKIVADALRPVATELRLIDAADLVSLLRYERWGNIADLVNSAAELYFLPGTIRFGIGGNYEMDWNKLPQISLDLEIMADAVTVYAQLSLTDELAGIEINHITFHETSDAQGDDTALLAESLSRARFVVPKAGEAANASHTMM